MMDKMNISTCIHQLIKLIILAASGSLGAAHSQTTAENCRWLQEDISALQVGFDAGV